MAELETLPQITDLSQVEPADHVSIKVKHDSIKKTIVFENIQKKKNTTDVNVNVLNGGAVLNPKGNVNWEADDTIEWIEIVADDSNRLNIWDDKEPLKKDNKKQWTGKIKKKDFFDTNDPNSNYTDWKYKVKYKSGDTIYNPDPIIRVNK